MPSLLDIGKSAIDAQRQALGVTGQNIANVNTEGYRKRDASIVEVSGQQSEIASKVAQLGLGVSFSEVRRSFNAFLAQRADRSESMFHAASSFVDTVKNLENLVLLSNFQKKLMVKLLMLIACKFIKNLKSCQQDPLKMNIKE